MSDITGSARPSAHRDDAPLRVVEEETRGQGSRPTERVYSLATLAILCLAIVLQLPSFDRSLVPMDEGHLAALVSFMDSGKALYADLHTGIFPGIYQLTRLLFAVFGDDLLVTRWAEVAVNASIAVSSGSLTSCSTLCAVAPGHRVTTWHVRMVKEGSARRGVERNATAPHAEVSANSMPTMAG